MSKPELITIGAFARTSGLTPSALRFYADSGLLRPASVDPDTGYRYYGRDQLEPAVTIRRLRRIGMPLDQIAEVLTADGRGVARVIDEHVAGLARQVHQARQTAAAVKAELGTAPRHPPVTCGGSVFTAAVEQILTATAHEPGLPVLNGVRIEVSADAVVLTATDRYRLSTRSLPSARRDEDDWAATLDADDLRSAMPWTRRRGTVELHPGIHGVLFRGDDGSARECRTLTEPFPDHRRLLASLPEPDTRALVSRNRLLEALEKQRHQHVRLHLSAAAVAVSSAGTAELPPVAAVVTGPATTITFDITTLHPAISTAVGPDVLIDIAGPRQPIVVRSADNGDLTTLAMPIASDPESGSADQEGTIA